MEQENPTVDVVLRLLAAGALLTVAVVAPGVPWAIARLSRDFKKYNKRRLRHVVKRLADQEVIGFSERSGETTVTLTEKGKLKMLKFDLDNMSIQEPDDWDGKWRLVVFDIPEYKKAAREMLRRKLKHLGFFKLQKSTFVHPFDCKDEIIFLKSVFEIGDYVKFMIVEEIEEEEFLKNWFGLD